MLCELFNLQVAQKKNLFDIKRDYVDFSSEYSNSGRIENCR